MPVRGTGRGRRLGLTREKVIAAAVELIDRDGFSSFSVRKLAVELDVETMSLYGHVANRDDLFDGIAETLLAQVDLPTGTSGTWQERIRAHAAAFQCAAKLHPKSFPFVLVRLLHSRAALQPIRSSLACVSELGLAPEEKVRAMRGFAAFVAGSILRETSGALDLGRVDEARSQQRLADLGAADPVLGAAAPYLAVDDYDAVFEYGLELLIAGLATRAGVVYDGGPARTD